MSKDAKGHGSNARGAAVQNYADVMKRNPGYGNLRAKGEALAAVHPDDKAAALALANGHPKSDAVPAHPAMAPTTHDISHISEYGLHQKLSRSVRVF